MIGLDAVRIQISEGRFDAALDLLEKLPPQDSGPSELSLLRGICLLQLGKNEPAAFALQDVLKQEPDCFEALLLLVRAYRNESKLDEAITTACTITAIHPKRFEGFSALGECLLLTGRIEDASRAFHSAVEISPADANLRLNLAQCHQRIGRRPQAEEQLRRAYQLDSRNAKACLALGQFYCNFGLVGKGLEVLLGGLKHSTNHAGLHTAVAGAYTLIRNDVAAEKHHRKAVLLSSHAKAPYALWLSDQGRNAEALTIYEDLAKEFPNLGAAYYGIVNCRQGAFHKEPLAETNLLEKMERLLTKPTISPMSRMYLHYALGRVKEKLAEYETSMRHFDAANGLALTIQTAREPFDSQKTRSEFRRVVSRYQELKECGIWGKSEESPIFIIGMIRSGTTLLDQIVSSHPSVTGAGELRFWIEKSLWLSYLESVPNAEVLDQLAEEYVEYAGLLAGPSERFTDKMPLNCFYAGLVHQALPNARFVHIRRHPVDTCLSIYTTYFGAGSEFVYNKRNTVDYYRHYLEAMEYWRRELPAARLLEVDYEDLISDPEPVIRRVIAFCGLPWDDACLHHEQNRSAINTPSRWQARQPVYKTSLERWRKYEPWLGEFGELLPPDNSAEECAGAG